MDETAKEWVVQYLFRYTAKVSEEPEKPWLKVDRRAMKWLQFFSGNEDPEGELDLVGGAVITDVGTAMCASRILQKRRPTMTFRIFNIHTEDFIMGDIL